MHTVEERVQGEGSRGATDLPAKEQGKKRGRKRERKEGEEEGEERGEYEREM